MKLFYWEYLNRHGYVIERTEAEAKTKVMKFVNIEPKNAGKIKIEYVKAGIEEYSEA